MKDFDRKELQELRQRAEEHAESIPNNHWKRAYEQLTDALDRLDAMEARTEEWECSKLKRIKCYPA